MTTQTTAAQNPPAIDRRDAMITGLAAGAALSLAAPFDWSQDTRSAKEQTMPTCQIPVSDQVDVLVIGGSSAAVEGACKAAQAGHAVLLLESRPYLGEERCATLAVGEERPLAIKSALEQRLLEAGVRFRFGCYLIDLLRDDEGRVGGALVGNRSGWQVVACRQLIDATPEGLALQLAGLSAARTGTCLAGMRIAADQAAGATEDGALVRKGEEEKRWPIWRRELSVDCGDGSVDARARAEQQARLDCFDHSQVRMADRLDFGQEETARAAAGIASLAAWPAELPEAIAIETLRQHQSSAGSIDVRPTPLNSRFAGPASVAIDPSCLPELQAVDVLVIGGGTAGAPAGIAAARAGADTLVCEYLPNLGGVGTEGLIAKYWHGNRCGFTSEVDQGVANVGPSGLWDPAKPAWNSEWKMHWYLRELDAAGGRAWFGSACLGVLMDGERTVGAVIGTPWGCGIVSAKACVDATGAAELPAAAGAPCRTIGADHVAVQGTGLSPRDPGRHYRNSDHTFIDDSDVDDVTQAHVVAKRRFPEALDCAQLVDSRERRQIVGDVCLDPLDFLAGRTWPDTVLTAASNFDSHGYTIHPVFMLTPPDKAQLTAHVPFRAMLPQGLEGVLVTGLGMSAHRDALPVVRMQADVQNQGYAAGYAAAMVSRENGGFRTLDIDALQAHLIEIGNLEPAVARFADNIPLPDAAIEASVAGDLENLHDCAVLIADPQRSLPVLKAAHAAAEGERRRRLGLFLLFCGDPSGAADVLQTCDDEGWDEGWNYRGMGQFGFSLSPMDVRLIALARNRAAGSQAVIRSKLAQLDEESHLSHCRAIAIALQAQPDPQAAPLLAALLRRPGMSGNHRQAIGDALARINDDLCDNRLRNACLKELHLARALVACGDHQGLGRKVLEAFATDLRGHYARHARALLAEGAVRVDAA